MRMPACVGAQGPRIAGAIVSIEPAPPCRTMDDATRPREGAMGDPVDVIELAGIGRALSQRLNAQGVYTTADLLRVAPSRLADAVDGASLDDVRRWQDQASILEIDGAQFDLAAALQWRGVDGLDEVGRSSLTRLRTMLEEAHAAGEISEVPADRRHRRPPP